jgi:hypothetical protein
MILLKKFSQIKLFQFIRVFQLLKSQAKTLNFNPQTKELDLLLLVQANFNLSYKKKIKKEVRFRILMNYRNLDKKTLDGIGKKF